MAGFGLLLERALFRPCKKDWLAAVVVSIGLTLILQSGAVVAFGLFERSIPRLARGSLSLMNISIPKDRIIAMAIAAGFFAGLYLFLKRTKIGLAMVASAQNQEAASLRGIDPNVMSSLAMSIACGLAAAGGAMAGSILMLSPFMGVLPLVKGLTIIVVGGMGSLFGSVVGGIMLGLIDAMFPVFFGSVFCSIAPLILVILILILKPQGLFGHE
jgi:branched-chain amino acid transport system permease protein